jgi:hypothetical protein
LRREVEREGSSETLLPKSQKNIKFLLRDILCRMENEIAAVSNFLSLS